MTAHPPRRLSLTVSLIAALLALVAGLATWPRLEAAAATPPPEPGAKRPTVAEARAFIEAAEKRLQELAIKFDRASWVQANFITQDTEKISATPTRRSSARSPRTPSPPGASRASICPPTWRASPRS